MLKHKHQHGCCKHCLHHCSCCNVVYCCKCNEEWGKRWYYQEYTPYLTYNDSTYCGTTKAFTGQSGVTIGGEHEHKHQ